MYMIMIDILRHFETKCEQVLDQRNSCLNYLLCRFGQNSLKRVIFRTCLCRCGYLAISREVTESCSTRSHSCFHGFMIGHRGTPLWVLR